MRPKPRRDDSGFTLIEVVVALVLLGMVATGALYFFISGTRTTSHFQRSQNAVAIANEAMERGYAVNPKDTPRVVGATVHDVPGMVLGRAQTDVTAAFAAASSLGIDGVDDTYPLWDPTVAPGDEPTIPLSYSRDHSGTTYDVHILVGSCFRDRDVVSSDQECSRLPGISSDPGDTHGHADMVRMLRVIAYVEWDATAGECPGGACTYTLSGLADRSSDLEWNQIVDPVAIEDFATVAQGGEIVLNVLTNDMIGPLASSPVTLGSSPAHGTASVASNGLVTYRAPTGRSGIYSFTYRIRDARGALSDYTNINVTVPPESADDTATAVSGFATTIPVTANDRGTPASVAIVDPPSHGTATVSGLDVRYTASIPSGLDTFTYTYTDASGQVSPEARVTVQVETLTAVDRVADVPVRTTSSDEWTDLSALIKAGVPDPDGVEVVLEGLDPARGAFRVDGTKYTNGTRAGRSIAFSPPRNQVGEHTFRYSLRSVDGGAETPRRDLVVRVLPVATDDGFGTFSDNRRIMLDVGGNDRPTTFGGTTRTTVELSAISGGWQCGTFGGHDLADGEVGVNVPNFNGWWNYDCSFSYRIVGEGTLSALRSDWVEVEYRVRP